MLADCKAKLAQMLRPSNHNAKQADHTNRNLLRSHKPRVWNINIPGNKEIQFETSFNQLLISVCSELSLNSNTLTTFEFYNALSLLERRAQKD